MADELEPSPEDTPIDVSVPRECIYRSYLVGTRRGDELTDSFMMGNKMGWFCTHCPVVVIDPSEVSEHLPYSLPKADIGNAFVVAGIINLDAVPKDKRELHLGGDDNPIPLVQFTNVSDELPQRQSVWSHGKNRNKMSKKKRQKKAEKKKRKRRRK